MKIFLSPPHMSGKELEYVKEVFDSNYIAPAGKYLRIFEEAAESYTGAPNALAVVSASAALHLALAVLGVQRGDRVIASTFTFIGSVGAAHHIGCELIFLDSDTETWCIDPVLLEEELKRCGASGENMPKALILTHLYGQSAKLDEISEICRRYGVAIIEDAAESLGCIYKGRHTGTIGDIGVYSFNGNKILTTSGGGLLVSSNKEYIDRSRFLSTQAREPFEYYQHEEVGFNYRMSNVLAAIGAAQMEVIEERVKRRRDIFDTYKAELPSDRFEFMPELAESRGNRWLTTCLLRDCEPMRVSQALSNEEIESRPLWKPMHMQPVFRGRRFVGSGVAEEFFAKGLCLPSGTSLTDSEQEKIINIIKKAIS